MSKEYVSKLSSKQKLLFVGSLAAAVVIVLFGIFIEPDLEPEAEARFTVDMSMKEIAPKLGVTPKALARELALPLDAPKSRPLKELGISQHELDHAVEHVLSHRATGLKYYVYAALVLFGLVYLTRLGRPDRASISERKTWYPRTPYYVALVVAVVVCGFVLGKSPNPMEGLVKVFKSLAGLYPSVMAKGAGFIVFIALAIVGNKLICGWACPFGALQELFYSLPILRNVKRRRFLRFSNLIRGGLFIVMLLLLFGVVGGREGFVVYHYLNPFNLFNLDFDEATVWVTIIAMLALALFVYRPFCHLICPFGFISWVAERLSLVRVRIDREKCTTCGACAQACPSEAAADRMNGKAFGADCFSCARCLKVCPEDAIQYRSIFSAASGGTPQPEE